MCPVPEAVHPFMNEYLATSSGEKTRRGVELEERQFNTDPRFHSVRVLNWGVLNSTGRGWVEFSVFTVQTGRKPKSIFDNLVAMEE